MLGWIKHCYAESHEAASLGLASYRLIWGDIEGFCPNYKSDSLTSLSSEMREMDLKMLFFKK